MSDYDLEDALDGLIAAVNYCEDNGMNDLSRKISGLYQDVGREAPDEHWDEPVETDNLFENKG